MRANAFFAREDSTEFDAQTVQQTPHGSLSPLLGQPNSGIPEFGHYDWPKSDISDFG
jgi:hypothetical protein